MTLTTNKLTAALLSAALLIPAGSAFGNDWSKHKSRTRGTTIGATAGAIVGGPPGAVIGGALGNGVQRLRQHRHHRHHVSHYRHYRR